MALQLGQREYLVWGTLDNPNSYEKIGFESLPITIDIEEYNTNNASTIKNDIIDCVFNTIVHISVRDNYKKEWLKITQINRL